MALFHKHHPRVGSRPGTLAIPPGSPPPRIRLVRYSPDSIEETETTDAAGLGSWLAEDKVCWINVLGLGDEQVLRGLAKEFELHPLALEDAVNAPQRAKSELYPGHQILIARVPLVDEDDSHITGVPQVCFVIGKNYLLTFQERSFGFFDPVRERLKAALGPMRRSGPDYLAYAMLDTLVDRYFPVAEALSTQLDELDEEITGDPGPEALTALHRVRRDVAILRRVGWPQREAVSGLIREQTPFVSEAVRMYLRDTNDHIAQIMELLDSSREIATGLAEIYHSTVSQRTNEVMKVLTVTASVFIPLTFIAGIYGMNFEYMPELRSHFGYFVVLGLMAMVGVGMLAYFARRGWIGVPRPRLRRPRSRSRRHG